MSPVWISSICSGLAVLLSFVALIQKNSSTNATQMARLEVKLDSIGEDLKELKNDMSSQQHEMSALREKCIILERDQTTIWKRIDEHRAEIELLKKAELS